MNTKNKYLEWLRDRLINLILDFLCQILPKDKYFSLIIEPQDNHMIATLTEQAMEQVIEQVMEQAMEQAIEQVTEREDAPDR
jgi:hypothetical protein